MSLRYKVSPELADGDHWTVFDTIDQVIESIREWSKNEPFPTDGFQVEVVEMSDEDVAALPEI
jgi:hypothetical protein